MANLLGTALKSMWMELLEVTNYIVQIKQSFFDQTVQDEGLVLVGILLSPRI